MQNNKLACALLLALVAGGCIAQTQASAHADNVHTVDELVRIENAKALQAAQKEAANLGLAGAIGQPVGKQAKLAEAPRVVSFAVDSVSGVGAQLRADVTYDGMQYDGLKVGDRVGQCLVSAIEGKRVALTPRGGAKQTGQCPSAVWTGVGRINNLQMISSDSGGPQGAARPLPGVVPLPSGGVPPAAPMPIPVR